MINTARLVLWLRSVTAVAVAAVSVLTASQLVADAQIANNASATAGEGVLRPGLPQLKQDFGHYVQTSEPAEVCAQPGVSGVIHRPAWIRVEPVQGTYDFSPFRDVLDEIAASNNPGCKLFLMVTWKSFRPNNPCPADLQEHSAPNGRGITCFLWEPTVTERFRQMLTALAAEFDGHPNVEGFIFQETSLGLFGEFCQDEIPPERDPECPGGGTYTGEKYRDALLSIYETCSTEFAHSWCVSFMNYLRGHDRNNFGFPEMAEQMEKWPNVCISGPDIRPDGRGLYLAGDGNPIYEILVDYPGCRSNSAQRTSYGLTGPGGGVNEICDGPEPELVYACTMEDIFQFAVGGTFGDFDQEDPYDSGICVNSFIFWADVSRPQGPNGQTFDDALPVIQAHPYGTDWTLNCAGGGPPLDYLSDVVCDHTIVGTRFGAVSVSEGVACLAGGSRVFGPVTVNAGAGLVSRDASVTGPVTATEASTIVIVDSNITGPLTINDTTDRAAVWDTTFTGPVTLSGNTTGDEPIIITGNHITGPLVCTGNDPPPVSGAGGNTVTGPQTGQCADV